MKAQGTGLGLWITRQLTEMMKGQIKLYSVYGKGTCIRLCIPLKVSNYYDKTFTCIKSKPTVSGISSPLAPRNNINIRSSNYQIHILFDNLFLLSQIKKIESTIKALKLNLDITHHDFNQDLDFNHFNPDSLVIIICSFNSLKALDILKELKRIESMYESKLISSAVFNSFLN